MKTAIVFINDDGRALAEMLSDAGVGSFVCDLRSGDGSLSEKAKQIFDAYAGIVFIAAAGIVMRLIGPYVTSKYTDPAVVCVDTAGRYAISLLSGHEGGANALAYHVAAGIGAQPIITTGTEAHKRITVGIGCRRDVSAEQVKDAIREVLAEAGVALDEVRCAASIDIKRDEQGLLDACRELGLPLLFFSADEIRMVKLDGASSDVAQKHVGVDGVCEPCALLSGHAATLRVTKQIKNGVTIACAQENLLLSV